MAQQAYSRPAPRIGTVISTGPVTPNMYRVTLGGSGLADFPPEQDGGYVKLKVPSGNGDVVRTYTVRRQRKGEIDIDFALHDNGTPDAGPATRWALEARAGDEVPVGGPGAAKPLPTGFDFYLVAGDMAALPAISANLERLDASAKGIAILEVQDETDIQPLIAPAGMELRWIVNPHPGRDPERLENAVREVRWPDGRVYGWVACEFSAMRLLRQYLRTERGLAPDTLYISSYWKAGLDEAAHKVAKREDAEAA
ncbi:siderophore-interacting protein [Qipengyuania sp. JC766]|uniref:siderophore-interacting protein n=1 Tax=Qipengyuania sp. JC766 TaxID=3232139 RepID=UPI00345B2433